MNKETYKFVPIYDLEIVKDEFLEIHHPDLSKYFTPEELALIEKNMLKLVENTLRDFASCEELEDISIIIDRSGENYLATVSSNADKSVLKDLLSDVFGMRGSVGGNAEVFNKVNRSLRLSHFS